METMCQVLLLFIWTLWARIAAIEASGLRNAIITSPYKQGVLCIHQSFIPVPAGPMPIYLLEDWSDLDAFLAASSSSTIKHNESILVIYKMNADWLTAFLPLRDSVHKEFGVNFAWLPSTEAEARTAPPVPYIAISNPRFGPPLSLVPESPRGPVPVELVQQTFPSEVFGIVYVMALTALVLSIATLRTYMEANGEYLQRQRRKAQRQKTMKKYEIVQSLGKWEGVMPQINLGYILMTLQQICLMLLVLYYFQWVLIVLNIAFPLLFIVAFDDLFGRLIVKVTFLPGNRDVTVPCVGKMKLLRLVFLIVPTAAAIVWFIHRQGRQIWLLHNIMSCSMCVWLASLMRLPSMSIGCLVAIVLAMYDFFMVYVTPSFTHDKRSIMEVVARGTEENGMPMVIHMPSFTIGTNYPECFDAGEGFIGMGDLIIPGFLVNYCAVFDAMCRRDHWLKFSFIAVIAYEIGLIITYIAKNFMETPQPALVFILPSLFISILLSALIFRVFHEIWTGDFTGTAKESEKIE